MNIAEMRGRGRYSRPCVSVTAGEASDELLDRGNRRLLPLFYSVHEAVVPLIGGTSLSLGRRHLPLHVPPSLSRAGLGFRSGSWDPPGAEFYRPPDQSREGGVTIIERKI